MPERSLLPLRYRKRPVVIEAVQMGEFNGGEVANWCGGALRGGPSGGSRNGTVLIPTLEGTMVASPGDYVIRGVQGEFYPCKPDIFAQTYAAVAEPEDKDCPTCGALAGTFCKTPKGKRRSAHSAREWIARGE